MLVCQVGALNVLLEIICMHIISTSPFLPNFVIVLLISNHYLGKTSKVYFTGLEVRALFIVTIYLDQQRILLLLRKTSQAFPLIWIFSHVCG